MAVIIALIKTVSLIKIQKDLTVLVRHLVVLRIFFIKIQIFPVYGGYSCRIFRSFHSSLYFQGIHTCFQDFRQDLNGTHILWAQQIPAVFVI